MNKKIFWILISILSIILVYVIFQYSYKEHFSENEEKDQRPYYDCIISINVHEKFDFLLKQLENIKENVRMNYAVILNCNDFMYQECTQNRSYLSDNVYIHDKILNKRTYHGSIFEGIYNNIQCALDKFTFDYLIVASSRNFFINMNLDDLKNLKPFTEYDHRDLVEKQEDWEHWPIARHTLLGKYYGQKVYNFAHEGLVLTENNCKQIVQFFEKNRQIKHDSFNSFTPAEEFAIQTVLINSNEPVYNIGKWSSISSTIEPTDTGMYTYKVTRE